MSADNAFTSSDRAPLAPTFSGFVPLAQNKPKRGGSFSEILVQTDALPSDLNKALKKIVEQSGMPRGSSWNAVCAKLAAQEPAELLKNINAWLKDINPKIATEVATAIMAGVVQKAPQTVETLSEFGIHGRAISLSVPHHNKDQVDITGKDWNESSAGKEVHIRVKLDLDLS